MLLANDPDSRKSAASVTIAMGHFQDPDDCQGLAHLLEHLLFLGNEENPSPNHLADTLASNGGHVNAWTGTEQSSFYFDVLSNAFEPALAQFSAMLSQPLFLPATIEKEIQAIDAEFKLKQQDDLRRLYQVHKETCNPTHPFSKFSVGNAEIFGRFNGVELQEKLRAMHAEHYRAENMTICLVSDLSLDDMEGLARRYLSGLSAKKQAVAEPLPPLYLPEQLGVILNIVPLKTARRMIVSFALPDVYPYYRSKPLNLISHLIGDEGPGSLLSRLKGLGWATSLSAGGGIQGSNFKDFNINLQLTELGAEHWQAILGLMFSYLQLIRQQGVSAWRFEERRKFGQMAFDFHDKPKPVDLASHLSVQMQHFADDWVLCGDYLMDHFEPELIHRMLDRMTAQNMRLKLILPELQTDRLAAWYATPYKIFPLPAKLLQGLENTGLDPHLSLPSANDYLSVRTTPVEVEKDYLTPVKLKDEEGFSFWFAQDNEFKQPKGELYLSFDSAAVLHGEAVSAYKRIWTTMVQERLSQDYYQAMIAGLHFHFYAHQGGFSLHTSGFTDRQFDLAEAMLEQILSFRFSEQEFEQARLRQWQAMQNSLLNKPVNRLFTRLSVLLQPLSFSPVSLLPILEQASSQGMKEKQREILGALHLESFAYGDWPSRQARDFSNRIAGKILHKVTPTKSIARNVIALEEGREYLAEVPCQAGDHAVLQYFQTPTADVHDIALTILTEQLLAAPFFNQLRTEKQLGYLVGSGYMPYNQHPGMGFYIQSPNHTPEALVSEIEHFLQQADLRVQTMPEEELNAIKAGVAKQLDSKDNSLSMRSQRLWLAIGNKDWHFDQQHRLSEQILTLSREEILTFCRRLYSGQKFGSLLLYSRQSGQQKLAHSGTMIEDLPQFKATARQIR
ncbi:insulinase family protein [Bowmanella dokdonensis]|nr:insulinase family protein [Bowmanella dokdonensis]